MSTLAATECLARDLMLRRPAAPAEVETTRRGSWLRPFVIGVFSVLALTGALVAGILPRIERHRQLAADVAEASASLPRVNVVRSRLLSAAEERVLPGTSSPLLEAGIYARTNGYLKSRLVEIGDRVSEGQLLAEIATPEIDAQLEQARATLLQTQATVLRNEADEALAAANLERAKRLFPSQGIAQQELDTNVAQAKAARATTAASKATLKVNQANIDRLVTLQSFQKVTAPFAGVITARNVDPGALVSADSPNTTREMFHLMRVDTLRVFVNVPQVFSTAVRVGQTALVYRREDPGRTFTGTVTRTAEALDPATRTLLTEVQVPNKDGALRAGLFLQVKFLFQRQAPSVVVPAAALATRSGGPRLAVLDEQNCVHYKSVQLGRDFGREVEVVAGLGANDRVVVRPGDDLPEGTEVEVAAPPAEAR
jgi:RND family efflux transporter MFP subunit